MTTMCNLLLKKISTKTRLLTLAGFLLACVVTTAFMVTPKATSTIEVFHIQNFFTEAYLLKGDNGKLILIETGIDGYENDLVRDIEKLGFKPENISLAIVTHGHGDHAGNARFLQLKGVPIAGSAADMDKFTSGKSDLVKSESIGVWGDRFRSVSDLAYKPFTPDLIIDKREVDLSNYGFDGKIIPMPGHTPGSLIIHIGKHLFVGDLFCATFKPQGQSVAPDGFHARAHFFHEDKTKVKEQLNVVDKFVTANKIETLYPIHFGAVSAHEFKKFIKDEPLLKELSDLQTNVLKEIVQKKSGLVQKHMQDDAVLVTLQGLQLTKGGFVKGFIENPEIKIESIAPEDFRIVYANETTAVMNYRENIKLANTPAVNALVTISYSKVNGVWKVVAVQATQIQV